MCSTERYTHIFIVTLLIIPNKIIQNEQIIPQRKQPKYPQIGELLSNLQCFLSTQYHAVSKEIRWLVLAIIC